MRAIGPIFDLASGQLHRYIVASPPSRTEPGCIIRETPSPRTPVMQDRIAYQGITFDDVLLEPAYSDVVPRDVDVRTQLTQNIRLNIPILSSPMDTVTEADLAIALAQEGGLGIIHKNMSVQDQTREVDKVKRSENGIITDPVTLGNRQQLDALERLAGG